MLLLSLAGLGSAVAEHPGIGNGHEHLFAQALQGAVQPDTTPARASKAQIEFSSDEVNLGTIFDTVPVATKTLTVRNVGTEPLIISNLKASCGCTEPKISSTEIAPGDSAQLEIGFKPAGRRGPQHKTVTITSNSADQGVHQLQLKGFVRPVVWTVPSSLSGGAVVLGDSHTSMLKIRGLMEDFETSRATVERFEYFRIRRQDPQIVTLVVDPQTGADVELFTRPMGTEAGSNTAVDLAAARETDPTVPATISLDLENLPPVIPLGKALNNPPEPGTPFEVVEARYEVEFRTRRDTGRVNEIIRVPTNQEGVHGQVRVPFIASIVGRVMAVPQVVALGVVESNTAIDRTFRLRSRSGAAFRIEGFDPGTDEHNLEATWKPVGDANPPTEYEVHLTGLVQDGTTRVQSRLVFNTVVVLEDRESEEALEVPLNAVVRRQVTPAVPATGTLSTPSRPQEGS